MSVAVLREKFYLFTKEIQVYLPNNNCRDQEKAVLLKWPWLFFHSKSRIFYKLVTYS